MNVRQAVARPDAAHAIYDGLSFRGSVRLGPRGYEARDADGRWIGAYELRVEAVRAVLRGGARA